MSLWLALGVLWLALAVLALVVSSSGSSAKLAG